MESMLGHCLLPRQGEVPRNEAEGSLTLARVEEIALICEVQQPLRPCGTPPPDEGGMQR